MAKFDPAAQSFDPVHHVEDDMTESTLPRIRLFVPSYHQSHDIQSFAGHEYYPFQQYSDNGEITSYDLYQEHDTLPLDMAALELYAGQSVTDSSFTTTSDAGISVLTATTPPFIPVKSSKLDATAPSFFLSRLAIFDPPADDLVERPRRYNRVLPDARNDKITDSIEMMRCPSDGQVGRFTEDTLLEFNKGLHYNDPVLAAMYDTVNAQKKQSFAVFALRLNIRPVNDAPPLWPPHLNLFDIKSYYFEAIEKDSEKKAKWVTILPNGSPPTAETVHIYETARKKWIAFGDWLEKAVQPRVWVGRLGYHLQFKWYKRAGSKRRFEDFPAEIREKIYKIALGGEIYPLDSLSSAAWDDYTPLEGVPRPKAQLTLGLGYHRGLFQRRVGEPLLADVHSLNKAPESRPFVYAPALSLTAVNSTIRDEFLHFAWVRMRSRFFKLTLFQRAMDARAGPAMAYKYLSKVELSFTMKEWFKFFGVNLYNPPFSVTALISEGHRFRELDNLRDLHLRFRSPDDGFNGSPWGGEPQKMELARYGESRYVCCQRTMVDWICTFA
jgi:hypothetical protein